MTNAMSTQPSPDNGLIERLKNILAVELRRPEMSGEPFNLTTMAENVAAAITAMQGDRTELVEDECKHDWHYNGTDRGGSHKGEDAYKCHRCGKREYQA